MRQPALKIRTCVTPGDLLSAPSLKSAKQYGVGIGLEDIQAQQDVQRARADYLNAIAEFNKAQFDLSKAIGTGVVR